MEGQTLIFAGDSITDCGHLFEKEGFGDGYVILIHDILPQHRIINRGYDGYTVSRLCRMWDEICTQYQPDLVTLLVGINDVSAYLYGGGYDETVYAEYLEEIILRTREKTKAEMILMEPFVFTCPAAYRNYLEPLARFREKARALAERYGIGWVPLWDVFQEAQKQRSVRELTPDGIHLTPAGHEILAQAWVREYLLFHIKKIRYTNDSGINYR